jgi:hypothetical protein
VSASERYARVGGGWAGALLDFDIEEGATSQRMQPPLKARKVADRF